MWFDRVLPVHYLPPDKGLSAMEDTITEYVLRAGFAVLSAILPDMTSCGKSPNGWPIILRWSRHPSRVTCGECIPAAMSSLMEGRYCHHADLPTPVYLTTPFMTFTTNP
jgi:hypothetical protein